MLRCCTKPAEFRYRLCGKWIREGKLPAYKVGHSHRRVRRYLPTADVGWLYGYLGAVAVAADDTISPSVPGVEVCP